MRAHVSRMRGRHGARAFGVVFTAKYTVRYTSMKHSSASASTIRSRLSTQLAAPVPMRRGSLTERFVKCSRPGCPCAHDPAARHGPYVSLTRAVAGTTRTRLIAPAVADTVRRQIEVGRQFRDATELYWAACERLADAEVAHLAAAPAPEGEKGGSVRRSKRRLRGKSRG